MKMREDENMNEDEEFEEDDFGLDALDDPEED